MWVPPTVSEELRAGSAQYKRDVYEQIYMRAATSFWNRELKQIDPYLELVRAQDDSTLLRPGFWYVLRHNPGAPPSLICVEGPDGEFVEPSSGLFELLRKSDMWNAEAERDRKARIRATEEAERRRKEREQEDRVAELRERFAAVTRTQVSMSGRYSQNAAGRRGRKP